MSAYDAPIGPHGPILSPALSLIDLDPAAGYAKYGHDLDHDHDDSHYEHEYDHDYEDVATEPFPIIDPPYSNGSGSGAASNCSSSPELYFIDENTSVKVDARAFSTQFAEVAHARKLLLADNHHSSSEAAPAPASRPHRFQHHHQHEQQQHHYHHYHHQPPWPQACGQPSGFGSRGAAAAADNDDAAAAAAHPPSARPFNRRDLSYWSHPQPGRRSKWQLWYSQGEGQEHQHEPDQNDAAVSSTNNTGSAGYHHSPTAAAPDGTDDNLGTAATSESTAVSLAIV